MLSKIKNFFDDVEDSSTKKTLDKNLACATLMVEAATMDGSVDESELATIKKIIMKSFDLDSNEANELLIEIGWQPCGFVKVSKMVYHFSLRELSLLRCCGWWYIPTECYMIMKQVY